MGFERWGYQFDGTYIDPDKLQAKAGVYVIWCHFGKDIWKILDVGESDDVKDRVKNHERSDCWKQHCSNTIYYSATYIPKEAERIELERKIRNSEDIACGER